MLYRDAAIYWYSNECIDILQFKVITSCMAIQLFHIAIFIHVCTNKA